MKEKKSREGEKTFVLCRIQDSNFLGFAHDSHKFLVI